MIAVMLWNTEEGKFVDFYALEVKEEYFFLIYVSVIYKKTNVWSFY